MNYLNKDKKKDQFVSREEHEELLSKYQDLLAQHTPKKPIDANSKMDGEREVKELEGLINQVLSSQENKNKIPYNAKKIRKESFSLFVKRYI